MIDSTGSASPPRRVVSLDLLRGLTIFAMIFVNDIAGVAGTPAWLKHFAPSDGNGMTVVDVVFPAFLFIVGLAIPLAFRTREGKGEATGTTMLHVLTRTASLLVIGVLMVNSDVVSPDGLINPNLWTLLMYAGVFLVWVRWPTQTARHKTIQRSLQLAGALLLVALALIYRGGDATGWMQLRPYVVDSVPASVVSGSGLQRQREDGTTVTCIDGDYCRWYENSGTSRDITPFTQDLRLAGWTGVQGLSFHGQLRTRFGSDDAWPRTEQEIDLLTGYLSYNRSSYQIKAGRMYRSSGLGFYNFDGASLVWKGPGWLWVDAYGGWSLARAWLYRYLTGDSPDGA